MAVLIGDLVNRDNVDDLDDPAFELDGAAGVHSLTIGGRTFVYSVGFFDDGISGFELLADGSLTSVENVADDATLALGGAISVTSSVAGDGFTYLYVAGQDDDGLSVFRVAGDGTLANVQNIPDDAMLQLNGARLSETVEVAGVTYLVAHGIDDDGISIFEVGQNGELTNTDNVADTDDPLFELDAVSDTKTVTIGGSTFVIAAGQNDDGISVFELQAGGTLSFVQSVADAGTLELDGAADVETAVVGGITYVFVSGFNDDGISVFSMAGDGTLTSVFDLADTPTLGLDAARSMSIFTLEGETFLPVSGQIDDALNVFHVANDGTLTEIETIFDDATLELDGASFNEFTSIGGVPLLTASGLVDNGLSTFEIGGGDDVLNGSGDGDTLLGLGGDDTLTASDDDRVFGGLGNDTIINTFVNGGLYDGGDGTDTIDVSQDGGINLTIDLMSGIVTGDDFSTFLNFENAIGIEDSSFGDTILGTDGANMISGLAGDDVLVGRGGDDMLFGGLGDDILDGGLGDDTLNGGDDEDWASYAGSIGGIFASLLSNDAFGNNISIGSDTFVDIENLEGSRFNDTLEGDGMANKLSGGLGEDVLRGEAGADILDGGFGNDRLQGGAGGDILNGGDGSDLADYTDVNIDVNVTLRTSGVQNTNRGPDQLISIERVETGGGDDNIKGNDGENTLAGGLGSDTINGFDGADRIFGGGDGDFLFGAGGIDTIFGQGGADLIRGNDGGDTLNGGGGADNVFGGDGSDTLIGEAADDNLFGENDADTLNGGSGDDVLRGGSGADIFDFDVGNGFDRIRDWEDGTDMIDLINFGYADAASALADFVQQGVNVRFVSGGDTLVIENEVLANITGADLILM